MIAFLSQKDANMNQILRLSLEFGEWTRESTLSKTEISFVDAFNVNTSYEELDSFEIKRFGYQTTTAQ